MSNKFRSTVFRQTTCSHSPTSEFVDDDTFEYDTVDLSIRGYRNVVVIKDLATGVVIDARIVHPDPEEKSSLQYTVKHG